MNKPSCILWVLKRIQIYCLDELAKEPDVSLQEFNDCAKEFKLTTGEEYKPKHIRERKV